jgi:hypothetical protein
MPSKYIFTATKKDGKYYIMYLFCLQKSYDSSILPKIDFTDRKGTTGPYSLEPSTPNENPNSAETGKILFDNNPKSIDNSQTIIAKINKSLEESTKELEKQYNLYYNQLNYASQFIIKYLKEDQKKKIEAQKKKYGDLNKAINNKKEEDDKLNKEIDDNLFKAIKNKKDVYSNYEQNLVNAQSNLKSVTNKKLDTEIKNAKLKLEEVEGSKKSADSKLEEAQYAKNSAKVKLVEAQNAKKLIDDQFIKNQFTDEKFDTLTIINDIINNFNIDLLNSDKSNFETARKSINNKSVVSVVNAIKKLKEIIKNKQSDDTIFENIKINSKAKFMEIYNPSNENNEWGTYFDSYYYKPQLFLLDDKKNISKISITINGLNNSKPITIPSEGNMQIIQIDDFYDPPPQKCCTIC